MIAYIKYQVGYLPVEMGGFPVPYTSWSPNYTKLIYTSYYLKALGWSGEGIVHLEELAFWIFLIHLKDSSRPWFRSVFFRVFLLLSLISSGVLVFIVSATKPNVLLTQAIMMTFATGFNTTTTCAFFWVFSKFPSWLEDLKKRGAPAELIIKLHGFGSLNQIRMIARLIFTVPLFALSADGLRVQPVLNRHVWVIDLIVMTSTVAFAAQGVITLLIFLPRNLSKECGFDQDERLNQDKSSQQPLLNRTLKSGCLDPTKQRDAGALCLGRPSSPTTLTCSTSEKHRSYSPDIPTTYFSIRKGISHSFRLSDANSFGNTNWNSDLNNLTKAQTQSVLPKYGREYDRTSYVTQDLVPFSSRRTSHISVEIPHVSDMFSHASKSVSPSFPPSTSGFNSPVPQGNSVHFPITSRLTHFPRYFAPSECRAFESCEGGSSKSLRTMSMSFSINETPSISDMATPQHEQLNSIHPAIRYFKSPIDISSAWFLESPETENLP